MLYYLTSPLLLAHTSSLSHAPIVPRILTLIQNCPPAGTVAGLAVPPHTDLWPARLLPHHSPVIHNHSQRHLSGHCEHRGKALCDTFEQGAMLISSIFYHIMQVSWRACCSPVSTEGVQINIWSECAAGEIECEKEPSRATSDTTTIAPHDCRDTPINVSSSSHYPACCPTGERGLPYITIQIMPAIPTPNIMLMPHDLIPLDACPPL
eukprot:scaffold52312_cov19-Tisochrysis_lutea.AAC.11